MDRSAYPLKLPLSVKNARQPATGNQVLISYYQKFR